MRWSSSSSGGGGGKVSGSTLTIYSSLPLQGTSHDQSQAVINGEKLALNDVGGKVGKYKIKYVSLDDSTAQNPGSADDGQTQQNARKAVSDKSTIYYLGDFNSGGTKVSLPILNKAGIPQISPSNTYVGLTTNEAGSEPGEPQKYYPGLAKYGRTYARTVPRDTVQGAAQATIMKEDGCKTVDVWNDKTTYGAGIAKNVVASLKTQGIKVGNQQGTDRNSPNYRSQAANAKGDCFFWGGVTGENGVQVFKDVAAANPTAKLFGPDGVAEEAFTNPKKGGIPAAVGKRVTFTVATLGVKDLPDRGPGPEQLQEDVQRQDRRPVRDLRLRDDGAGARHAQACRGQGQRPRRGRQGAVRDEEPQVGDRDVLDRQERRHVADRLRRLQDQGRSARVPEEGRRPEVATRQ